MRQTISITIEHSVVASNRSYEQVKKSLEAGLGVAGKIGEIAPVAPVVAGVTGGGEGKEP